MTSPAPYAEVIGDPIAHSKSPLIHGFWLRKLGIAGEYRATLVRPSEIDAYLQERQHDPAWRGCNVTMPLKVEALSRASSKSQAAEMVGATNLLVPQGGKLFADNSDVIAIQRILPPKLVPSGSEICIIGTGGAARSALAALKDRCGIALITARAPAAGFQLLHEFGYGGTAQHFHDPHNIQTADCVINATPLGMTGQAPMPGVVLDHLRSPLSEDTVVFDMVTSPAETQLLRQARGQGLRTINGLEMLVAQAIPAFRTFFGAEPPREYDAELMDLLAA
jgi:shikimate dehydrogenase